MKKYILTALLSASLLGSASAATLVYGGNGEPVSLEPGNITDGISITVQRQLYDTLVDFKDGTTDPAPGLAVSWRSNPDATQLDLQSAKGREVSGRHALQRRRGGVQLAALVGPQGPQRLP